MSVTLFGMVIEVRLLQPVKAKLPILVTLLGIVIEVRLLQPEKAVNPMLVTLCGMIVFLQPLNRVFEAVIMIALQLSRESNTVLPDSTTIEVRLLQPKKILWLMLVTLFGMVIDVKLLQFSMALLPMLVTPCGMVTEVRLEQP